MTLCGLFCLSKSEEQSDRKDGQRTGQLDDRRVMAVPANRPNPSFER